MATFIDLFAGIGGFHYALQEQGHIAVFASEWDKDAIETYEKNHGLKPHGDITKISVMDVPTHDIVAAGFPCQAFSISGKQSGFSDPRGTLFFEIARIAKHHRPKILFLENVRNFAKHDNGNTLKTVLHTLDELGYNSSTQLFNASDFGLPQNRQRFFIVAVNRNFSETKFEFPSPSHLPVKLEDVLLEDESLTNHLVITRDDIVINKSKIPVEQANKPIRIGQVGKGGQGERIYSPLGHAITLSAYGGGVGSKTGLYLINDKVRKLHPRECARLQGFPETFILPEKNTIAWKQFGNSVPIHVLKEIVRAFTEQYDL
ncbi:MAG: DNA cytosine methyltransferase [Enterococcus sp.]|nr:DNA cytosine methyltransferase [Enterococcus sp.]